jgi:hypoxanthine phosphoribosyltransferase
MKVLFEKSQIETRIKEIGVQILYRHKEESNPIVLIGVLNGGFMFYSKLVDQLALLDPQCDFIRVKSYKGREHEVPEIIIPTSISLKNKHVYIIDDIYDTGLTMRALTHRFSDLGASGVSVVTLIKRSINEVDMPLGSIYGFEIHDEWVVGYGMDDEEGRKRSLPHILAI